MDNDILNKFEEKLGRGRIKTDESLSAHTTFQIGGPADFYFEANSTEEITKAAETANKLKIPYFIVGGGSNILVGDKGFRGLVIKNNSRNIKIVSYKGTIKKGKFDTADVLVEVDTGVPFNQLVRFTLEESLSGFEEFLGLPGSVGGAVTVNAHWRDKRVRDFIVSQKTLDKNLVLSVVFKLKKEDDKEALWQKAQQTIAYRQNRHPVNPSAGCIFRNIEKSKAVFLGTPKATTAAGFLIEAAGLKGTQIGNAQISPQHCNFIVNLGGAKASDVLSLIDLTKEKVRKKFKVKLDEEIIKVGAF